MYSSGDARVHVGPGLGLRVQSHGLIGEDMDSRTVGRQVRRVCKHDQICSAYKPVVGRHVAFRKLNLHWNETFMCWRLSLTHSQDLLLVRTLTGHFSRLVFPDTQNCTVKLLLSLLWNPFVLLFHFGFSYSVSCHDNLNFELSCIFWFPIFPVLLSGVGRLKNLGNCL